jgi:ribosome-associated protein
MEQSSANEANQAAGANREAALAIAETLEGHQARDTLVIDIGKKCSFADFFVIATVNSAGHLRGLIDRLEATFAEYDVEPLRKPRRVQESGWTLIDCGFVVVHLMSDEMRAFYELEDLWFTGTVIFGARESANHSG